MIKLGIVGISEGNGHPYSWGAIINGYDREAMASCPFPVIPQYLGERPDSDFGIGDARVTHIWTQDTDASGHIARASKIETVAMGSNNPIASNAGPVNKAKNRRVEIVVVKA